MGEMEQEYRIDQKTGEVYTRDQWDNDCNQCVYAGGDPQPSWDSLPVVVLPAGKEDETREKLKYIYGKKRVVPGDLVTKDMRDSAMFVVEDVNAFTMKVKEISTHHSEIWSIDEIFYKVTNNPNQVVDWSTHTCGWSK